MYTTLLSVIMYVSSKVSPQKNKLKIDINMHIVDVPILTDEFTYQLTLSTNLIVLKN